VADAVDNLYMCSPSASFGLTGFWRKMLVILEIQRLLAFGVLTPLRQSVAFCPPEKNFTLHFLAFLSGLVHKVPIRTLPSKLACQDFKGV